MGQNEYGGAKQVTRKFYVYAKKIREPMVIRSTFLFSHGNRKSKTDDLLTISSLAFNSETKVSSDSLCPTIPYFTICVNLLLAHTTLIQICHKDWDSCDLKKGKAEFSLPETEWKWQEK